MKKVILSSLFLIFFLQSCNVYKETNSASLKQGKTYKIQLETEKIKAKYIATENSELIFLKKKDTLKINQNDIKQLKLRKFSTLKTIGCGVLAVVGISVVDFIIDPKIGTGATMNSPN